MKKRCQRKTPVHWTYKRNNEYTLRSRPSWTDRRTSFKSEQLHWCWTRTTASSCRQTLLSDCVVEQAFQLYNPITPSRGMTLIQGKYCTFLRGLGNDHCSFYVCCDWVIATFVYVIVLSVVPRTKRHYRCHSEMENERGKKRRNEKQNQWKYCRLG
jgi:hypothetical protein